MSDCTCKPPTQYYHESATMRMGNKYAVRLDCWDDDSETDPKCPYHGVGGSMVVTLYATGSRRDG